MVEHGEMILVCYKVCKAHCLFFNLVHPNRTELNFGLFQEIFLLSLFKALDFLDIFNQIILDQLYFKMARTC